MLDLDDLRNQIIESTQKCPDAPKKKGRTFSYVTETTKGKRLVFHAKKTTNVN